MTLKIFGHRGYPARFPENSLAGFAYACQHGIDGIELDVHLTQDEALVVIHDEALARTTDATGRIKDLTLQQVQAAHLANNEAVPTLSQALAVIAPSQAVVNIELKTNEDRYPGIEAKTQQAVVAAGMSKRVVYSSFNPDSLAVMHELAPEMPLAQLAVDYPAACPAYLTALHLAHPAASASLPQRIWTVNDPWQMRQLASAAQVTAVITDHFEEAQALVAL